MAQFSKFDSIYVRFADKGDYFLAIRTPCSIFAGARIHGHRKDGSNVTVDELAEAFGLKFIGSTRQAAEYATLEYTPTSFISKKDVAIDISLVTTPFEAFLSYLEAQGATVDREAALTVFTDSTIEHLEFHKIKYPLEGTVSDISKNSIVNKVGDIYIQGNIIQKEKP